MPNEGYPCTNSIPNKCSTFLYISFDSFCPLWYNKRLISLCRACLSHRNDPMTTFNELLAPVTPIIQQIEHDRPKHHNEDLTWSSFVQILLYFFTNDLIPGTEL